MLPQGLAFRLLFAFLALHFVWSTLRPSSRSSLDSIDFETRDEDGDNGQHYPFGMPTTKDGRKRALHPQELCAWETVRNVSACCLASRAGLGQGEARLGGLPDTAMPAHPAVRCRC